MAKFNVNKNDMETHSSFLNEKSNYFVLSYSDHNVNLQNTTLMHKIYRCWYKSTIIQHVNNNIYICTIN